MKQHLFLVTLDGRVVAPDWEERQREAQARFRDWEPDVVLMRAVESARFDVFRRA
jgi:hypothetical protein